MKTNLLITGGAGFIGSHITEHFVKNYPNYQCTVIDCLNYAANLANLDPIKHQLNFSFVQGNILDQKLLLTILHEQKINAVINLAAETHVDKSIQNPLKFVENNVMGTVRLLDACREYVDGPDRPQQFRILHISTDEVFGSIETPKSFTELSPYTPRSPYSASKAAADHFTKAYYHTYKLPVIISYSTNNFGPYQYPEKLIPLIIYCVKQQQTIPVYGQGQQMRDWIYVKDHVLALDKILHAGKIGETYAISAHNELSNIALISLIGGILERKLGLATNSVKNLIQYVPDRLGHDFRYALNTTKINSELNWYPTYDFVEALEETVDWYLMNMEESDDV